MPLDLILWKRMTTSLLVRLRSPAVFRLCARAELSSSKSIWAQGDDPSVEMRILLANASSPLAALLGMAILPFDK